MESQSSFAMAFRAIVMLCCLILVPLVALFGTTLPETVKRIVQHQLDANTASAAPSSSEPFAFAPAATQPSPMMPDPAAPAPLALAPAAASPIGALPPAAFPGTNASPPAAPSGVIPAAYSAPLQPMGAGAAGGTIASVATVTMGPAVPMVPNVDRFTYLKDRLRDLGATYYLLETWGNQGQLFRFYCKMAIGGSPNYARYFEATDADPLRAMSAVLEQVETWRAARP